MPRITNWKKISDNSLNRKSIQNALPGTASYSDAWYYTESKFDEKATYVVIARFNRARTSDIYNVYMIVGDEDSKVTELNIRSPAGNLSKTRENTVEWLRNHPEV